MQGGPSTQAPMLPRAALRLLGAGLQGYYADLLKEPLPAGMKDALSRIREVPQLLPSLLPCQQVSASSERTVDHQPVPGL
jgi:hypothetical protein